MEKEEIAPEIAPKLVGKAYVAEPCTPCLCCKAYQADHLKDLDLKEGVHQYAVLELRNMTDHALHATKQSGTKCGPLDWCYGSY